MSTSIQEQDIIQHIKGLEERLRAMERSQRTIGSWTITTTSIQTGDYGASDKRYFGIDGLSISDTFTVDPNGNMTATSANIANTPAGGFNNPFGISVADPIGTPLGSGIELEKDKITLTTENSSGTITYQMAITWNSETGSFDLPALTVNGQPAGVFGAVPASVSAGGNIGDMAVDSTHLYIATGLNTWKRVALSSF